MLGHDHPYIKNIFEYVDELKSIENVREDEYKLKGNIILNPLTLQSILESV